MGNAQFHGRRSSELAQGPGHQDELGNYATSRSPATPGSPLTYSPQVPMEPLSGDVTMPMSHQDVAQVGLPAQPKLMPTVIVWPHGGESVEVQGSFDNWSQAQALQRSGKDWTIIKLLPPGVYQYKFIVDGKWRHDHHQPVVLDDLGNINNVVEVQEYVPENLEGLAGFDPPPSPKSSYNNSMPTPEDLSKDPPLLPPHLKLTLLNVPPALDAQAVLPRPQHVILNHVYDQSRFHPNSDALVLGVTHRYRSKYVTVVMYKPRNPAIDPLSNTQPPQPQHSIHPMDTSHQPLSS